MEGQGCLDRAGAGGGRRRAVGLCRCRCEPRGSIAHLSLPLDHQHSDLPPTLTRPSPSKHTATPPCRCVPLLPPRGGARRRSGCRESGSKPSGAERRADRPRSSAVLPPLALPAPARLPPALPIQPAAVRALARPRPPVGLDRRHPAAHLPELRPALHMGGAGARASRCRAVLDAGAPSPRGARQVGRVLAPLRPVRARAVVLDERSHELPQAAQARPQRARHDARRSECVPSAAAAHPQRLDASAN